MPHHGFIPSDAEDLMRRRVKAELRKRIRGVRKSAPASACTARSLRIVLALETLPALRDVVAVALFWPIEEKHEVDLRTFDASLRARGVRVAYPAIEPDTGVMSFRFVLAPAAMEERGYGFREPSASDPEVSAGELSAIVVPALAVDPSGHRIGYGAGYYDRTLPRFVPPAVTIAVAYDYQLVVEVPATSTDVAVDWIVTDTRVMEASRS